MPPYVYITRNIPEAGLALLRNRYELSVYESDRPIGREALKQGIRLADALISLLSDPIDTELLDQAEQLKIIANYAVGYNNIDVAAALERRIMVTHTPGVLTNATAELAFSLIIALSRRVIEADRFTREGRFVGWDPLLLLGDELSGKTLGIIGMGRIGQSLAEKCRAFGMSVIYYNRKRLDETAEKALSAEYRALADLLAEADIISIHSPLTEETRHLINREALSKVKPGACLINTARGEIIDEAALAEALSDGRLKGAGLDVYEQEPAVHPDLFNLENVILLPHIGSATVKTRENMAILTAENVIAALEGKTPENLVPEMKPAFF